MATKNYRVYQERRRRLGEALGNHGIILLPGAKAVKRNADTEYPFRQESSFLYLTGFTEPDALLVVMGGKSPRSTLFCNPNDTEREIWTGKRFGPERAKREFGFHQTFSNANSEMVAHDLAPLLRGKEVIYYPFKRDRGELLRGIIDSCLKNVSGPRNPLFLDGDRLIGEMRLIKDGFEIDQMAHAANVSARAYCEILTLVRPGMTEIELEAEFVYRFRKAGGDACHAYPPIVSTGENACTLHHTSTNTRIRNGDLVLVDAGCEYGGYASDITRTFPANGKFTPGQRALYEIVLTAQKTAIDTARSGVPLHAVHDSAALVIAEGLIALGILEKMKPEEALEARSYRKFFPHGTSHWLGLDVHDAGDYVRGANGRSERVLVPGMVITVEPGIYIQPNEKMVEKKWRGIGVRIEDDVLITEKGNRVFSSDAPKEINEIEKLTTKK